MLRCRYDVSDGDTVGGSDEAVEARNWDDCIDGIGSGDDGVGSSDCCNDGCLGNAICNDEDDDDNDDDGDNDDNDGDTNRVHVLKYYFFRR